MFVKLTTAWRRATLIFSYVLHFGAKINNFSAFFWNKNLPKKIYRRLNHNKLAFLSNMHRPFKDAINVNASSNTLILVILTLTISLNSLIITSHYIAYHFSILFLAQKIEIYILKAHIRCSFMSVQVLLFAIRNPRTTDR